MVSGIVHIAFSPPALPPLLSSFPPRSTVPYLTGTFTTSVEPLFGYGWIGDAFSVRCGIFILLTAIVWYVGLWRQPLSGYCRICFSIEESERCIASTFMWALALIVVYFARVLICQRSWPVLHREWHGRKRKWVLLAIKRVRWEEAGCQTVRPPTPPNHPLSSPPAFRSLSPWPTVLISHPPLQLLTKPFKRFFFSLSECFHFFLKKFSGKDKRYIVI